MKQIDDYASSLKRTDNREAHLAMEQISLRLDAIEILLGVLAKQNAVTIDDISQDTILQHGWSADSAPGKARIDVITKQLKEILGR